VSAKSDDISTKASSQKWVYFIYWTAGVLTLLRLVANFVTSTMLYCKTN